jgi:hypothetical protein
METNERSASIKGSPTRCPYCHDQVDPLVDAWRACSRCLSRHHDSCWIDSGCCGACGEIDALVRPVPRIDPRELTALWTKEGLAASRRWLLEKGYSITAASETLLELLEQDRENRALEERDRQRARTYGLFLSIQALITLFAAPAWALPNIASLNGPPPAALFVAALAFWFWLGAVCWFWKSREHRLAAWMTLVSFLLVGVRVVILEALQGTAVAWPLAVAIEGVIGVALFSLGRTVESWPRLLRSGPAQKDGGVEPSSTRLIPKVIAKDLEPPLPSGPCSRMASDAKARLDRIDSPP